MPRTGKISALSDSTPPDASSANPDNQQKPVKKQNRRSSSNALEKKKNAVSEVSPNRNPTTLTSFQHPDNFQKKTVTAYRESTGPLRKAEDTLNKLNKMSQDAAQDAQRKRASRGPATASTQPVEESSTSSQAATPSKSQQGNRRAPKISTAAVAEPKGDGRILSSPLCASPTQLEPEETPHYTLKSSRKKHYTSEWHDLVDSSIINDNDELRDFMNLSKPDTTNADYVVSMEAHARFPTVFREKDYIAEECGSTEAEAILNCKNDVKAYVDSQKGYLDKLRDVFSGQNSRYK